MDLMDKTLASFVAPAGRFRRSVRLDADADQGQLEGYLPTARSIEVIRRLQRAMSAEGTVRAVSITGPYGSGKSSLALFVDALCGNTRSNVFKSAVSILRERDPDLATSWNEARKSFGAPPSGFVRAVITTPQREPIALTVLRAIKRGSERTRVSAGLRQEIQDALDRAESRTFATPSYGEIKSLLQLLTQRKPMILVIDEFGKNLEAFADSGSDGDLYLLQELAEWANQGDGVPLLVVTIQHLAFDSYVTDATSAQRREWSKVQGRFEDIPFVDSGSATRQLVRAALEQSEEDAYVEHRDLQIQKASQGAMQLGAAEVADTDLLADCFPLHPSTLAILPELCARYGQNERTLFSFIASGEPKSVGPFLVATTLGSVDPWVRLHRVYDYFVESAGTFIGASSDASRWLEIETTIRDAPELSTDELEVLKTVGILNLVAGQASLRASRETIGFATGISRAKLDGVLEDLVESGLLVYREFAQEFRIWRGSDFDISSALRTARSRAGRRPIASLLGEALPLEPLVAAKHSIRTGTTRAFARIYADSSTPVPNPDQVRIEGNRKYLNLADGLLVYNVDANGGDLQLPDPRSGFPIVVVTPPEVDDVVKASVEIDALLKVRDESELDSSDSAAWKEINERIAYARQVLEHAIAEAFEDVAATDWINSTDDIETSPRLNTYLSAVLDVAYCDSPIVLNETINRTDLTSQGARARRDLVTAMLHPGRRSEPLLGLDGDGPEVSMYHALLGSTGIHSGAEFVRPDARDWEAVWDYVADRLHFSTESQVAVDAIISGLSEPPYGVREGPAMVLFVASLVANRSSIAIYEHGSYRPVLDAPLSERLMKNPANFSVKYLSANPGTQRHDAILTMASALNECFPDLPAASAAIKRPTILTVTLALMGVVARITDDFTKRTSLFQSLWDPNVDEVQVESLTAVRDALLEANEPDVLLFESLPSALGFGGLPASGRGSESMDRSEIGGFSTALAKTLQILERTRSELRAQIVSVLLDSARSFDISELVRKAQDVDTIEVISPDIKRFGRITLMRDMYTDEDAWVSALTEAVCGQSFLHWDDESAMRHLQTLEQTSADLARVSELVRFREGQLEGAFRAFQIHATSEDGKALRRIVTLPQDLKSEVAAVVDKVKASLVPLGLGAPGEAAGALLASLIDSEIAKELDDDDVTIDLRSEEL